MSVSSKRPKRCQHSECRKRLLLTDQICRCNKYFCGLHRLPEQHNCEYNYKSECNNEHSENIIKKMKCVNERVKKI